jgi:hypothetical protein
MPGSQTWQGTWVACRSARSSCRRRAGSMCSSWCQPPRGEPGLMAACGVHLSPPPLALLSYLLGRLVHRYSLPSLIHNSCTVTVRNYWRCFCTVRCQHCRWTVLPLVATVLRLLSLPQVRGRAGALVMPRMGSVCHGQVTVCAPDACTGVYMSGQPLHCQV